MSVEVLCACGFTYEVTSEQLAAGDWRHCPVCDPPGDEPGDDAADDQESGVQR